MISVYAVIGFLFSITGWLLIIFALWRNDRAAKDSDLVDNTNRGPRFGAIIEVTLHPDHAAEWWRYATPHETALIDAQEFKGDWVMVGVVETWAGSAPQYIVRVFPNLGKDSSEIHGIRQDDLESS